MSVKDYVDVNGKCDETTSEEKNKVFFPPICARCGYEPDSDGYCNFCGHLNRLERPA